MRSVVFIGKREKITESQNKKVVEKIDYYKCIFCGKEYENVTQCNCEHSLEFKILNNYQAEAYKRCFAKFFIEKTGKQTIHIFTSISDYDNFLKEKEERRAEQKRKEEATRLEWERNQKIWEERRKEEEKVRLEFARKYEERFNKAVSSTSLKELLENVLKMYDYSSSSYDDELETPPFDGEFSGQEILTYIINNFESFIDKEIGRRRHEEMMDE